MGHGLLPLQLPLRNMSAAGLYKLRLDCLLLSSGGLIESVHLTRGATYKSEWSGDIDPNGHLTSIGDS